MSELGVGQVSRQECLPSGIFGESDISPWFQWAIFDRGIGQQFAYFSDPYARARGEILPAARLRNTEFGFSVGDKSRKRIDLSWIGRLAVR